MDVLSERHLQECEIFILLPSRCCNISETQINNTKKIEISILTCFQPLPFLAKEQQPYSIHDD